MAPTPAPRSEITVKPKLLPGTSVAAFEQAFSRLVLGMDAVVSYGVFTATDGTTTVIVTVSTTTSNQDAVTAKLREAQSSSSAMSNLGVSSLTIGGDAALDSGSPGSSGLGTGAIAGTIIGCVVAVGVVIGLIVFARRDKLPATKPYELEPSIAVELSSPSAYRGL